MFRFHGSRSSDDPVDVMEAQLTVPLQARPDWPTRVVSWRGVNTRGGGYAALMPTVDEFFGTSSQVCGGFWPFNVELALPAEGCRWDGR